MLDQAREIFFSALQAVDARAATRRAVSLSNSLLRIGDTAISIGGRSVYLVAIGKAAGAMTAGLAEVLNSRISRAIVCGPTAEGLNPDWAVFAGGHPFPTEASIAAARASLELLAKAERNALIVFLISGGGSAMFELPVNESISLADLREANRQLVSCGASIAEINAVRRAFSAVKGGKLASIAPHRDQITLIVSDTNPGDATSVASGPTLEPDAAGGDAREVVQRYGLLASLPHSILGAIEESRVEEVAQSTGLRAHYVLLDNRKALESAAAEARSRGFIVELATDINEQEIGAGCDLLIARSVSLWNQNEGKPVCLVSGGEFLCPVRGSGVGGRNLETVLRSAMKLDEMRRAAITAHWAVLSAGTDGVDGNSKAAGAVADETTIARAKRNRLESSNFLEHSDAFHFFEQLGDLIVTGLTGTNVRDVRIVLVESGASSRQSRKN
ncbi:MAG: glycerate kinase type-2 family protein [Pyrinomonadaceae bacterium]